MEFFDSLQTEDKEFYQYLVKQDVLGTLLNSKKDYWRKDRKIQFSIQNNFWQTAV